jgi:hypothetical protein
VEHALDLDQSPGTEQSGNPMLVYNSDRVNVRPIVQALIQTDNTVTSLPSPTLQLTWDGTVQPSQTFSPTGFNPGDVLVAGTEVSSAVTGIGRHAWSLAVTIPGHGTSTIRTQVLQAGLERLEPRPTGRPRHAGATAEVAALEGRIAALEIEPRAAQVCEEIALALPAVQVTPGGPEKKVRRRRSATPARRPPHPGASAR